MLACLSRIQEAKLYMERFATAFKKTVLPYVLYGGRDMILLVSDTWIEVSDVPEDLIKARYDSNTGRIMSKSETFKRWIWVTASTSELDISEFMSGLRISTDLELTELQVLLLYIHQTGNVPKGELSVMLRNGTETSVSLDSIYRQVKITPTSI